MTNDESNRCEAANLRARREYLIGRLGQAASPANRLFIMERIEEIEEMLDRLEEGVAAKS